MVLDFRESRCDVVRLISSPSPPLALSKDYILPASLVFVEETQPFDSGMGVFTLKSVRSFSRPLWERRLSSPGRLLLFLRSELTASVLICRSGFDRPGICRVSTQKTRRQSASLEPAGDTAQKEGETSS